MTVRIMNEILSPLIGFVREMSPCYGELYADVPKNASLKDLPVIDHATYWDASRRDRRSVMTGPQMDGVVLKTGGKTEKVVVRGPLVLIALTFFQRHDFAAKDNLLLSG